MIIIIIYIFLNEFLKVQYSDEEYGTELIHLKDSMSRHWKNIVLTSLSLHTVLPLLLKFTIIICIYHLLDLFPVGGKEGGYIESRRTD